MEVVDNDTAQKLRFEWGFIDYEAGQWEPGETWIDCPGDDAPCVPGPAEGIFYYENDRRFIVHYDMAERFPAHFRIRRRAEDVGQTATFVVRVEHNRGWVGPRHAHWPIDPVSGNHYFEFPLTLTGDQRQVVGRIELMDNGVYDPVGWEYRAEIRKLEDVSDGDVLTPEQEAEYWTVLEGTKRGNKRKSVIPPEQAPSHPLYRIEDPVPARVMEGEEVTVMVRRFYGYALEPAEFQVRTWEPNRVAPDGSNPTEQVHTFNVPAAPLTDRHILSAKAAFELTLTATQDSEYEEKDFLRIELAENIPRHYQSSEKLKVPIIDDDHPTVSLSASSTSVTEGDPVTFTITRASGTTGELVLDVAVDDPGGFLQGNVAWQAVEVPSTVIFAPGETVKEFDVTPPDDWRDIPDSTLTFSITQEPHFEMVGPASLTVQVSDNDVAPQVQISFYHLEVDEGDDLILAISRTGDDRNPLEIEITQGPVDDQQYVVVEMGSGESLLEITYSRPDDSFKQPDTTYEATLHPGPPEFWTVGGQATVTGTILDDDPYRVGVTASDLFEDEGQVLHYRVIHDGHTADSLPVKVEHTQVGSAVSDFYLGTQTHTISAGSSGVVRGFASLDGDGSDGDAEFIVEILPGDDYEIDPNRASVTITVRDRDALPVLELPISIGPFDEGAGNARIPVDLVAHLPVLRNVSVDYEIVEADRTDGADIVESTGTLEFPAGTTRAFIETAIVQDSIAERDEQFTVTLRNPVFATLQDGETTLSATAEITDDEPLVSIEGAAAAVTEGSDVVFDLTRSRDTTAELTVRIQVTESAPRNAASQLTATFPAGQDAAQLTVSTEDDEDSRGTYTVTAALESPGANGQTPVYSVGAPSSASVTVRDDDLPEVWIQLINAGRINEGKRVRFDIARFGKDNGSPLTVNLRIDLAGDYTTGPMPTSVTLPLHSSSKTVSIPTDDDSVAEDAGQVTVTLLDNGPYRPVFPTTYTFTIFDDDGQAPTVSVNSDQNWVDEGEDVTFEVTRTGSLQDPLDATLWLYRLRSRVTAADLSDPTMGVSTPVDLIPFDEEELELSFPAGTGTLTVTRQTTDDNFNYGNSSYHAVVLAGPDDGYNAFYDHVEVVWVQDDERPTVTVSSSNTVAFGYPGRYDYLLGPYRDEPELRLPVTLTRTGDASGLLTVRGDIEATLFWPAPLQDIHEILNAAERAGLKLYIPPGETSFESTISGEYYGHSTLGKDIIYFLDDPHYCPDRPAACGHGPQYTVGTPDEVTIRVYGNFMGVRIEADQSALSEGGTATFTLHRHGGKPDAMTRPLHVNVGVTQEGDYISGAIPQRVSFLAGQSSATLSVPTIDDGIDEPDGAISVRILPPDLQNLEDDENAYLSGSYRGTPWVNVSAATPVNDDDYVPPEVSVADGQAHEDDRAIEFTVSLERANYEQASSVDWATLEIIATDAATAGTDFTAASGTLNFAIGETEKTVTVALLDDHLDESHERFSIVLSSPTNLALGADTAIGTILDDEMAAAVIFASPSRDPVEEGEDIVVRMQRLFALNPGQVVNVDDSCGGNDASNCFTPNGTAQQLAIPLAVNVRVTQDGDVISGTPPTTVTFQPGSIYAYVTVSTDDDAIAEPDGVVQLEILNGPGYSSLYLLLAQHADHALPTMWRTVYDNDLALSVGDAAASEDAGALEFTVSLNAPAPLDLSVDVTTLDGEATSGGGVTATSLGQDYTSVTRTLNFLKGEVTQTFSVAISDDSIQEGDETFTVRLSNGPANATITDDTGIGTIIDDEQPMVVSVSRTYSIVNEDMAGPVSFKVELGHPDTVGSERDVSVGWRAVAGTATEGDDYLSAGGVYDFPVGTTVGFLDVSLVDDAMLEAEFETFTVELTQQGTDLATLSTTGASYEVSIRDNEMLTAAISAETGSVAEGDLAVFRVTLSGDRASQATDVHFEASGDARSEEDYGVPSGSLSFPAGNSSGKRATLHIPAGQVTGTITYPILNDIEEEENETLTVRLLSVFSGQREAEVSPTQSEASSTILDQGALTISIAGPASVDEGDTATYSVYMTKTVSADVTVEWSTRQPGDALTPVETADTDVDYMASTGAVTIPAGSTGATFTVSTTEDNLFEGDETFRVKMGSARRGSDNVPKGVTQVFTTIVDNDAVPGGITVSASPRMLTEDAGPTDITVTVTLDGTAQLGVDTPVTIEFLNQPTPSVNAILGEDYSATTANVVIIAGQSSATTTVTLTPEDDNIAEANEVARLTATSAALMSSDELDVVIEDDDVEPVEMVITATPGALDESVGAASLNVTASLVGQTVRQVDTVVTVTLVSGTATEGEDFEAALTTLEVPAGEFSVSGTLDFTVTDDTAHEGDETLEVSGDAPGLTVTGAEVIIRDDDTSPTSIGLSVTDGLVAEGDGAVSMPVQATLLGGGTRTDDTTVNLSMVDLTSRAADDYTAVWESTSIAIPAGRLSATTMLTLTPVQDAVYEGDETVAVRGRNSDPGLPVNGLRLTIRDDDLAPTTVSLAVTPDTVSETIGVASVDVTATLEGDSTLSADIDIEVSLVRSNPDATTIMSNLVAPLIITAGESSGSSTIVFSVVNDDVDNEDETIAVRGTSSDPAIQVAQGEIVIEDDDSAGVTVSERSLTIAEGDAGAYTVALDTQPSADVTVTISGHAGTDVSLTGQTLTSDELTFTPDNWSTAQTVTVNAGEDDDAADESEVTLGHAVTGASEYAAIAAAVPSVSVTITEDDIAGVTISERSLTIAEGESGAYTVALDTQPSADVTVTISGHAGTDVSLTGQTLTSDELTFTPDNWSTAQTVTVNAGEDDDAADESEVTLGHAVTGASEYEAVAAAAVPSVSVTITDDDIAGVTISERSLTIGEGESGAYTVALDTQPSADVTVTVSGHAGTDVSLTGQTLTSDELTFTPDNWSTAQTVTVNAGEDDDAAADTDVTLTHAVTGASEYAAIDAAAVPRVSVTITEDDSAGVAISESSLTINEGGSDTYTVALNTQPSAEVTVTISGHTGTDVRLSDTELDFTPGNWDTAQTVTVTAGEDDDATGDTDVTLSHAVTGASEYAAIAAAAVPRVLVTITENDSAGVSISRTTLTINEGGSDTYTVKLDTQPSADVTVTISGHTGTDVSLSDTELDFTPGNWDTAQTVTVTAGQDDDAAADTDVTLTHAVTGASEYAAIDAATVPRVLVKVTEDDSAGVAISRTTLTIDEGGSDTYTVALNTEPSDDVTVTISGHTGTDVRLSDTELDFTPGNWDTAQTVTVTAGEDDDATADTEVTLSHAVTGAGEYEAIAADDVPSVLVTITENDSAGVSIVPTTLTIDEGASKTYTVALNTEPSDDVTVTISGHAGTDVSLDDTELDFTPGNWDTAQTVTVTAGQDDDAASESDVTLTHAVTGASEYAAIAADDVPSVAVRINEDDSAGVTISRTSLTIGEGGSETYTVKLNTEPSADVTVTISGHSGTDVSLSDTELTFTDQDWDVEQEVIVTAREDDDAADESEVILSHALTGASEYAAIAAAAIPSVSVTITEDDSAGVTVSKSTLTIAEGRSETYTVVLDSEPSADVTVTVSGHAGTDVSLSDTELTFTDQDWDAAQTVTVTAEHDDDTAAESDVTLSHALTGASEYAAIAAAAIPSVSVTITEDDSAGVTVSESSLTIAEGGSETYTVVLDSEPTAEVKVTISGHSGTDVSLSDTELTFTDQDWDVEQEVIVTAREDDDAADESEVILSHSVTGASEYAAIAAAVPSVSVTITEDDSAGVSFEPTRLTVLGGQSNTYTVVLDTEPSADVTVTISGHSGTDVSLSGNTLSATNTLTFTAGNWSEAQTVTLTAGDVAADSGVNLSHAVGGGDYGSVTAEDVSVSIVAVAADQVTIQVGVAGTPVGLTVPEGGSVAYEVLLSEQPTGDVTLTVTVEDTANNDVSTDETELTFTTGNWNTAQSVTVRAAHDDDAVQDPVVNIGHTLSGANSDDVEVPGVEVTIIEDDSVGVTIDPTTLSIDEGGSETYTVKLDTQPSADVTVTISGHSGTDVSLSDTELDFTPGNWDTAQTVTVTAGEDDDATADTDVTLTHAVTGASEYAAIAADDVPSVSVTINEDDSAGVTISRTTLTINEGGSDTYTVALNTQPSADVTVTISGHTGTDVSLSDTELDFTPGNWNVPQTVTVTAGEDDDATADTDVTLTHAVTGASEYAAIDAATVPRVLVTINEDDSAGVTISRTTLTIAEGDSGAYTVVLDSEPTAEVTVTISGHSGTDVSLDYTVLTFTTDNWSTAQTVTVTAEHDDDTAADTDVTLTHAVTGASEYAAIAADDVPSVAVRINEDDSAGVTISRTSLTIGEGGSETYTVKLNTEPSADVKVTISGHTGTDVSLSDTELNFTPGDWGTAQTVTVTAGEDDDAAADTDVTLTHAVTGASEYAAIAAAAIPRVLVKITEDDSAGVAISESSLTIAEGGSDTYTVKLNTEPSAEVTVTISGHTGTDVSLSDTELDFTTGNWDTAQTVTVTAEHDDDAAADTDVTLTHAVTGASEYAAIDAATVPRVLVKVTEDDSAGVAISRTTLTINEGGSDTYTVKLDTEPSDDVTVTISGHSGTDVSLSDTELDFTPGNWDTAQTVTVTAGQDDDATGDTDVTLTHAVTGASEYAAIDAATVPRVLVKVTEDDSAGVSISRTTLTINEGGSDTYTVKLDTQPSDDVTVTISGHAGTDVRLDDTELDFTPGNWDTAQTVTVTAGQDDDATADTAELTHTVSSTGDTAYDGLPAPGVDVTVTDDDAAGVKISKSTLIIAGGGSDTYTVVLTSEPAGEVKVTLGGHAGTDLSLDKTKLTFTRQDWNVPQTVTVTAGEDDTAELTHTVSSTEDSTYNSLPADKVTVRITHDDSAGVTVSYETSAYELREGSDTEITVVLSNGPESPLTIRLSTVNQSGTTADDYSGVPLSVTFAIGETEKPFTFTAVQDEDDENAEDVTLGFDSLPSGVSAGTPAQTTVTILDSLRVAFSASRYEAYEGGTGAAVIVNFDSAVAQETVIPITATEMNGATDADWMGVPDELVFAPGQRSKTFMLMAYDDDVEDSGEMVLLEFGDLPAGVVAGTPDTATVELMNTEVGVCDSGANKIIVLDRVGSIGSPGETEFWTVSLDPYRFYLIEVIGENDGRDILDEVTYSGTLTLQDPDIFHIWNSDRSDILATFTSVIDNFGGGTDSLLVWATAGPERPIQIEVGSSDGGTGRYQVKVRVSNICYVRNGVVVYKYDGGPDGYPLKFDQPADTSTEDSLYRIPDEGERFDGGDILGNHGEIDPDVDWFGVELHSAYEYSVEVWTPTSYPEEHQATQLKILGIYDESGNEIEGTASSISGETVTVDFQPTTTGRYYLSVGSEGLEDSDHTGVYRIKVTGRLVGEDDREWHELPAPENLRAVANDDGSVSLTWDDPDHDLIVSYQILRHRPDMGEETPLIRLEDSVSLDTTYIDYQATPGVLHIYYVKSINSKAHTSELSNKAEVTPLTSSQAASTPNNTPATRAPTISGTALAGETLTADVSRIEDEDGMTSATFIYQWIRTDGGADAEIPDAVNSTYMVTDADVGKPIKVRVTFTDDAGNEESLTSFGVIATRLLQVPGAPGTPDVSPHGSGSLAVSWTAPDSDGGSPITGYKVQWKEAAGSWETAADVSEETVTGTTHTITGLTDEVEYAVRVIAISEAGSSPASEEAFGTPRDITPPQLSTATVDGTTLTLTYDEALAEDSVPGTDTFTVMAGSDERGVVRVSMAGATVIMTLDSAVMTGDAVTVGYAAPADESALRITDEAGNHGASFNKQAVTNLTPEEEPPQRPRNLTGVANEDGSVTLTWDDPGDGTITGYQILRRRPTEGEGALLVYVEDTGSAATTFTDANVSAGILHVYRVKAINTAGLSRMSNKVNVTPLAPQESAPNTPATGAPVIAGVPWVGETLTADVSRIEDEDGIGSATFIYQWIRTDGSAEAEIPDAVNSTYMVTDEDVGNPIKVRVTFTDDAGNEESLTSAGTIAVETRPNSPATGQPTIAGTVQVGETLTADASGIADADGLTNASYSYQWLADGTDIAGATAGTYTLTDADEGAIITVRVSFTDDAGNEEELTSGATIAVEARPNSPATGQPTIAGTVQVGETLTADTSGISDDDGLNQASYSYQWLADGADIAGATAGTYTLTDADEGAIIRVRVSFTDDGGHEESLTSKATDAVAAAELAGPPAKPTGLTGAASHDQVILSWDDPQDDAITGYVILRRVRVNNTGGEFSVFQSTQESSILVGG